MLTFRMQPFTDYVARITGRSVLQLNNQSYQSFLSKAQQGQFDLVYAPAHYAALLIENYHYQPLLLMAFPYQSVVISKQFSSVEELASSKALRIAMPNLSAIVSQVAMQELGPLTGSEWVVKSTHDRSLYALLSDEVDAAIVSSTFLNAVGDDTRQRFNVLARYGHLPGDLLLVNRELLADEPQLEQVAEDFPRSKEGKVFLQRWKIGLQLKPVDKQLLAPLKRLAEPAAN